jgi:hypothetical protein
LLIPITNAPVRPSGSRRSGRVIPGPLGDLLAALSEQIFKSDEELQFKMASLT